jgi:hypothetical protein
VSQRLAAQPAPHDSGETTKVNLPNLERGSVFDPRVDRVVTWLLGISITVGLGFGATAFGGMRADIAELKKETADSTGKLKDEISGLRTELAKKDRDRSDIDELKRDVGALRETLFKLELSKPR